MLDVESLVSKVWLVKGEACNEITVKLELYRIKQIERSFMIK